MLKLSNKKKAVVAGVAVLALSGTAYAYWTTTGTGTGAGSVGTTQDWVVTSDNADSPALSPNGPTQHVNVHVKNQGTGVQHLNAVSIAVANGDGSAWDGPGSCSAADFDVHIVSLDTDVAAGATVDTTATLQMIDTATNQDDCKNAAVPLYFAAS